MKELVVISGKGGTGKTSLTSAFAALSKNCVLCDADVDASDLHLLTAPKIIRRTSFRGGGIAVIDQGRCTGCGLCRDMCRFDAINKAFEVDRIDCEGCGVCVDFCPEQAIDFPLKICGEWYVSETRFGSMVHARLGIAEENSGKLVALIRQEAKQLAFKEKSELIITDGPPGVGCPVIASMNEATAVLIVTEPTVSGVHDLERVLDLAEHFQIPAMVLVNKFDLNLEQTQIIEKLVKLKGASVKGRLPFDPVYTQAMIQAKSVIEFDPHGPSSLMIRQIWQDIVLSSEMKTKGLTHKEMLV